MRLLGPADPHGHRDGGGLGDAGVVLGVCAGLEVPLMLGFGFLSTRVRLRRRTPPRPAAAWAALR